MLSSVTTRGALLAALGCALILPAQAEQYAVPIIIDNEDDIFDLFDNGDITEPEMDLLMELYQRKVDLNRATRDEIFELPGLTYPMVDDILKLRREKGSLSSLKELESAGAVPYLVMKQMENFVTFGKPKLQLDAPVTGSIRLKTLYQPFAGSGTDLDSGSFADGGTGFDAGNIRQSPSVGLRSRITAMGGRLNASWTILGRDRPGPLMASGPPGDPYFIARGPRFTVEPLRKGFVSYEADMGDHGRGQAILGTFNAGFGERLTFDTTNRRRPYGLYGDDLVFDNVGGLGNFNSDFRVHRGLQGIAGTVQRMPVSGNLSLDTTGWLSTRGVDEYMYRYRPNRTYFDENAAQGGPTRCTSEGRCHAFETFRHVFVQQVGGANIRLNTGDRGYIGFTAYAARNYFTEGDDFLNFAPAARQPIRRSFGASGLEWAAGSGRVDVFGEVTVTDRGAAAGLVRGLFDLDRVALEVTGRHYGKSFDNPFSRGAASPGQFLGLRGRNETGIKVRAIGKPVRGWRFVGHVDTWLHPAFERPEDKQHPWWLPERGRHDIDIFLRNEIDFTRKIRWAFWGAAFDKDLWVGGRDQDYIRSPNVNYDGVYDEDDPDLAMEELLAARTDLARGLRMEAGNQLRVTFSKQVIVTGYARMRWRDISVYDEFFERNASAWLRFTYKPRPWLDLSTRVRYWDDDIDSVPEDRSGDGILDYERGNAFAEGFLRVAVSIPKSLRASVRYDLRTFTDVKVRERDPQHLIRLSVEKFF